MPTGACNLGILAGKRRREDPRGGVMLSQPGQARKADPKCLAYMAWRAAFDAGV